MIKKRWEVPFSEQINRKRLIVYQHLHWLHILRRQLRGTNSYSGNESKLDCQHGIAAVDVEFAVAPIHHILNDDISDFAFSFEYFEHFGHLLQALREL